MGSFNNFYLRPNLSSTGMIPAAGPTYLSPDICIAGTRPIADYQKELKSPDSYASYVDYGISPKMENYIYLRTTNNTENTSSTDAFLYFSEASCIQWPSKWKDNKIPIDLSQAQFCNTIVNVPSKDIGVVEHPFIWRAPAYPPTNDHYCLIARLTSDVDPNPLPSLNRSIDMADLIRNNLRWTQRNVTMLKRDLPVASFEYVLDIPENVEDENDYYQTCAIPFKLKGCEIELTCSVADSDGNPISIPRTEIKKDDELGFFSKNRLKPGFRGLVVVYIYNPNSISIPVGSGVDIDLQYILGKSEIGLAENKGLLDSEYEKQMDKLGLHQSGITRLLKIGGYSGVMTI
ncbi:hypothetical protein [Lacrimispora defluvii]|uniref:Uncharacterized protein n=1 Tax=Lacrimispora defluvii TaxID=2719233 RepID=A0ABX1VN04_9FIRM|nr:hypothetical protein [Lacrimispora defluvii]NNJ29167.1 hypothetical protein [Lacrimispora defluvii]